MILVSDRMDFGSIKGKYAIKYFNAESVQMHQDCQPPGSGVTSLYVPICSSVTAWRGTAVCSEQLLEVLVVGIYFSTGLRQAGSQD